MWIGGCFSLALSPLLPVGANSISVSHLKLLPCLAGKLKESNMDQGANLDALKLKADALLRHLRQAGALSLQGALTPYGRLGDA